MSCFCIGGASDAPSEVSRVRFILTGKVFRANAVKQIDKLQQRENGVKNGDYLICMGDC